MKSPILSTALALLAQSLAAQDPQPFFIQFRPLLPALELKEHVGNRVGVGLGFGYTYASLGSLKPFKMTAGLRVDQDSFRNAAGNREAQIARIGHEFTLYFKPDFSGPYLNAGLSLAFCALTSRPQGVLEERQHTRPAGSVAFGYRFDKVFALEGQWNSLSVDSNQRIASWGLGITIRY